MRSADIQGSLDHLTAAGDAYRPDFLFRAALANQVYMLAQRIEEARPVAVAVLAQAVAVDPTSSELLSKLLAVQRALGQCDGAKVTADRMLRLAHGTPLALQIAALPCKGAADVRP